GGHPHHRHGARSTARDRTFSTAAWARILPDGAGRPTVAVEPLPVLDRAGDNALGVADHLLLGRRSGLLALVHAAGDQHQVQIVQFELLHRLLLFGVNKKTGVWERLETFPHAGLLANEPPSVFG